MASSIVAIHQPNFFPWLGYFQKIAHADVFVFLDAVQIQKTGGTWTNRVRFLFNGNPHLVSVPILGRHGYQKINEVLIDDKHRWRKKFLRSLQVNYCKCEHFKDVIAWLEPMIFRGTNNLSKYNISNVKEIVEYLGFKCHFAVQSESSNPEISVKTGSERLAAICKEVKGNVYLAGDGAADYENESAYTKMNVKLVRSNFRLTPYRQVGVEEFIPGLSILDALFNIGVEDTAKLLLHRS
jgi:hypothetical protein